MAKVIMVQGTMSNAGKSLIVAGLCRIFHEDGYRVAPFKSQNMALNSYITEDGCEIGRAQAVQAQACGIEPTVSMNPILLKPTTDVGSQVIVNGKPIGNMPAKEYFSYKKQLIPDIMAAYERLAKEYDIIVVEGAGSPAEINLKSDDIVNMGLAKMLDAPVLLVGDIDRGGVFAQLYGTVELLEEDEKNRIAGLIINKFRGDRSILEPGIRMIEEKCRKKVVGVIPYISVDIEEEDSLSTRFARAANHIGMIKVYVVKLPRISNYTDFAPLEANPAIDLCYVTHYSQMINPDWIIIPGTKNTIADLLWMRETGMEAGILKYAAKGCMITGICGGYQMLGHSITDAMGVESNPDATILGMGLLDITTQFCKEKTTRQSSGLLTGIGPVTAIGGSVVSGYEIHMGETSRHGQDCLIQLADDREDGCIHGNIFGTYFHGIFENEEFLHTLISFLAERKNLSIAETQMNYEQYKEQQFQILADTVRANLDLQAIYDMIKVGVCETHLHA